MKNLILIAASLSLATVALPADVEAKGCIRGAMAGAVAGHYAGHHAVVGAVGGCIAARAYYKHKAAKAAQATPAQAH